MRLISLYIENFGGLHQYSLEFGEGLTVLQEPNGFGKTTLAEFIRAMFYGFPRKAKTLDKSRRQKYTPWQGGKYGGNLVFRLDGTSYRIERSFGATPKGDTFNLIDLTTNKKSIRFSEEIGLELFQLDADSFERSTYMPQLYGLESLSTDNIQAKLGDLVEDSNDVGNFDRAVTALKSARSGFIPYRGSGGTVAEAQGQISRLQGELERISALEAQLYEKEETVARLEARRLDCEEQLGLLWEKLDMAAAAASVAEAHRERSRLAEDVRELEQQLAQLSSRYPRGMPGKPEIDEARRSAEELARLETQPVKRREDSEAEAWLEENGGRFERHVPSEEELSSCRSRISDLLARQSELENTGLSAQEQDRYQKLLPLKQRGLLEEERLDALDADNREMTKKRHLLEGIALNDGQKGRLPQKRRSPWLMLSWLLAAAGIGAGSYLLTVQMAMLAYGALGVGVAALIFAVALMIADVKKNRRREQARSDEAAELRQRQETLTREISGLEKSLGRILGRGDFDRTLVQLRVAAEQFRNLEQEKTAAEQERRALETEIASIQDAVSKFLGSYFQTVEPERFHSQLSRLEQDADQYLRSKQQVAALRQREESHRHQRENCQQALNGFLESWGLTREENVREQLLRIREESGDAEDWEKALEQNRRALSEYEASHAEALAVPMPEEQENQSQLRARESALREEADALKERLLDARQQCNQLRDQLSRIPGLHSELESWQEKRAGDRKKAQILDDTVDFLDKARESLQKSYFGPVRESFKGYLHKLTGEDAGSILLAPDLQVQLERGGEARELGYFSAGQADAVMLCMRLALVDALFKEVKPFVILDDPFVNLDDAHTAQALELLRELARDRQIIYLVCHSSRS